MATDTTLAGKTALVTGASRGIGRGIALALAEAGADILVHYARRTSAATAVVEEVRALGRRAEAVRANLADRARVDEMLDQVQQVHGGCDIFVANAASGGFGATLETTDKYWDWTMDINARSVLHCVQRLAPAMAERGWGRVIAITSLGSTRVIRSYGAVGISKALLESLVRYLAAELAPRGITVNAISPGLVETGVIATLPVDGPAALEHARRNTPARRVVTAEDVGRVAAFLCSEGARMIVGQTIVVDGGFSLLSDFLPRRETEADETTGSAQS